jgi:hypothetical protein
VSSISVVAVCAPHAYASMFTQPWHACAHLCSPQVETSLATQYPSLLSLGVASGYDKYNEDTAPEAVTGLYKVLPNKQWPSGKVVSETAAVQCAFAASP